MIDIPPLQFANVNGIRMGFYEAGPKSDKLPIVLCHGWPEIAFSWRHQIKALSDAGFRVIAPDQRGYGATDRPDSVEAYDIENLTADLIGLLDHLKIDKAIFIGHDWGGFIVWQMPLRYPARVAGVVGVNTPHTPRTLEDPIAQLRKKYGDHLYIAQFQDPSRKADKIFDSRVAEAFDFFMRKPMPRKPSALAASDGPPAAGLGASPKLNMAFPQMVAGYDAKLDPREKILSPEEMQVFVDSFKKSGFTGGINWYRNMTRNWERSAHIDHTVRVPSLMIMAEHDEVLPPSACDGMEKIVPDLEKYLVKGSGHWTQQEKPDEVSATIVEWRKRRFA